MPIVENSEIQSGSAELLQWSVDSSEQETTLALAGEVDLATSAALKQVLADVVTTRPAKLAIDLTKVTFLDSTGIRELMIAANALSQVGGRLVVRHPTAMIERTLQICGLHELLLEHSDGTQPGPR